MLLLPLSLSAGIALGCVAKGRLRALGRLRFRAFTCLAVALGAQLALPVVPDRWRLVLVLGSYSVTGAWLMLNARRRPVGVRWGFLLVAAGWFLNLLPVASNGEMPVSAHATRQVTHHSGNRWQANLDKHELVVDGARFRWLGDVIPVRPLKSVVSVGDLVMAVGIATTVAAAMAQREESAAH